MLHDLPVYLPIPCCTISRQGIQLFRKNLLPPWTASAGVALNLSVIQGVSPI